MIDICICMLFFLMSDLSLTDMSCCAVLLWDWLSDLRYHCAESRNGVTSGKQKMKEIFKDDVYLFSDFIFLPALCFFCLYISLKDWSFVNLY